MRTLHSNDALVVHLQQVTRDIIWRHILTEVVDHTLGILQIFQTFAQMVIGGCWGKGQKYPRCSRFRSVCSLFAYVENFTCIRYKVYCGLLVGDDGVHRTLGSGFEPGDEGVAPGSSREGRGYGS